MEQSNIYEINIKNQKNKNAHPIHEIQKIIESLYITRYKLIRNIYDSKIKKGFYLISQNNIHYEQIISIMKKLIIIIKNVKYFKLNIIDNICLSNYKLYYDKNDKYNNYMKYTSNENKITDSLYFGINDFIYYIIYILKNKELNRDKYLLKLLEIYKIVNYNLIIVNRTLDNKCLKYGPNTEFIDLNTKLLLNIKINYNSNYKVKIKSLEMDNNNKCNNKKYNECDFINKNNNLPKKIIIIEQQFNCFKTESLYIINKKIKTFCNNEYNNTSILRYKNHTLLEDIIKTYKNNINCNYPIEQNCFKNISFIKFTIINYKKRLK